MNYRNLAWMSAFAFGAFLTACSTASNNNNDIKPSLKGMKCEFVPDGQEAVIYGSHLAGADVIFPDSTSKGIRVSAAAGSNDSVLKVIVPKGSTSGKLKVIVSNDTVSSKFQFRDSRNLIIDWDKKLATWGGCDPYEENEEGDHDLISSVLLDSIVKLPSALPEGCSGVYSLVFGKYDKPWTMSHSMFLQYVANPLDGGRGDHSIAGPFDGYDVKDLALKFDVYIPKETPYKKVRTEIFFGPFDAPDKHGRDRVPICFWEPYAVSGSYSTDGWETVTIPLTEFTHTVTSYDAKFPTPIDLKKATNLTFVQFGDTTGGAGDNYIMMCVDNFRVVPISE